MAEYTEIQKYAEKILKDNGCDFYTYGDKYEEYCKPENIAKELQEVYKDGMDYPYMDVAQAILDISKPRYVKPEIPESHFDFDDWGSWGVGDFYARPKEYLESALNSGKTFDTGWHGYKKEIESMRIQRTPEEIIISCSASMDEALEQTDLFTDFLTEEELEKLSDDMIDEIRDYLIWGEFVEETDNEESIDKNSTMEEIMEKASELMQLCNTRLHESFHQCIGTTLTVMYGESDETTKMIEERCKQYN